MKTRTALLSNVNMDPVIRLLARDDSLEVLRPEGYGEELGSLLNPESGYNRFAPSETFFIIDLQELTGHSTDPAEAQVLVRKWFSTVESYVLSHNGRFAVCDALARGPEIAVELPGTILKLENLWNEALAELCDRCSRVRVFPYRELVAAVGSENAFSDKMWYMGRIPHSAALHKSIAERIQTIVRSDYSVPKKVLVLDLDNTIWGGLAGEHDITPIVLSDDHEGLVYRSLQRMIKGMRRQGVLLAICSKNNREDALELIENHPYQILRSSDFAAMELGWDPKPVMMKRLAEKLNLGLDSFVFFDDNPVEREAVKAVIPEVEVPDFPDKSEDLIRAMASIYHTFFARNTITREDAAKTESYVADAARKSLEEASSSFEEYLESLRLELVRVDAVANKERLCQLLNKTNQFNLTTVRHTPEEFDALLDREGTYVYGYRCIDKFGDNGIIAVLIGNRTEDTFCIDEFVMSCRVMGRRIEYAILGDVIRMARELGCSRLIGMFTPTPKNLPVSALYSGLGMEPCEGGFAAAIDRIELPEYRIGSIMDEE